MNPVFRAAAEANQLGWLTGIACIMFFVMFALLVAWWLLPGSREQAEAAARMPFNED
jgi:cbb3-type cytochrome oxidase subunit 3